MPYRTRQNGKVRYKHVYTKKQDPSRYSVAEHILLAESVLGRRLPIGAQIHHVDENGKNNDHSNLVICPSHAYHLLLHRRADALAACGNAGWRRCVRCGGYSDPETMSGYGGKTRNAAKQFQHRECNARHVREMAAKRKAKNLVEATAR